MEIDIIGGEKTFSASFNDEDCKITLTDYFFLIGDKKYNYIDVHEIERLEGDNGRSYYEALIGKKFDEAENCRIMIHEDEDDFESYFISLIQEHRELDNDSDKESSDEESDSDEELLSLEKKLSSMNKKTEEEEEEKEEINMEKEEEKEEINKEEVLNDEKEEIQDEKVEEQKEEEIKSEEKLEEQKEEVFREEEIEKDEEHEEKEEEKEEETEKDTTEFPEIEESDEEFPEEENDENEPFGEDVEKEKEDEPFKNEDVVEDLPEEDEFPEEIEEKAEPEEVEEKEEEPEEIEENDKKEEETNEIDEKEKEEENEEQIGDEIEKKIEELKKEEKQILEEENDYLDEEEKETENEIQEEEKQEEIDEIGLKEKEDIEIEEKDEEIKKEQEPEKDEEEMEEEKEEDDEKVFEEMKETEIEEQEIREPEKDEEEMEEEKEEEDDEMEEEKVEDDEKVFEEEMKETEIGEQEIKETEKEEIIDEEIKEDVDETENHWNKTIKTTEAIIKLSEPAKKSEESEESKIIHEEEKGEAQKVEDISFSSEPTEDADIEISHWNKTIKVAEAIVKISDSTKSTEKSEHIEENEEKSEDKEDSISMNYTSPEISTEPKPLQSPKKKKAQKSPSPSKKRRSNSMMTRRKTPTRKNSKFRRRNMPSTSVTPQKMDHFIKSLLNEDNILDNEVKIDFDSIEKELNDVDVKSVNVLKNKKKGKKKKKTQFNNPYGRILGVYFGIIDDVKTQLLVKEDFLFINEVNNCRIKYNSIQDLKLVEEESDKSQMAFEVMMNGLQKKHKWIIHRNGEEFQQQMVKMMKKDIVEEKKEDSESDSEVDMSLPYIDTGYDEEYEMKKKKEAAEIEESEDDVIMMLGTYDNPSQTNQARKFLLERDLAGFRDCLLDETKKINLKNVYDLLVHSIYSYRDEFILEILNLCPDVVNYGEAVETAIEYFYYKPVEMILKNLEKRKRNPNENKNELSQLHLCAISKTNAEDLGDLSNYDINKQDSRGWTALHLCAILGNIDLMKKLLRKKECKIEVRDFGDLRTPLHLAIIFGQSEAVKLLVKHKANIMTDTMHELNAYMVAGKFGRKEILDYLFSVGQENNIQECMVDILNLACKNSRVEIVEYLLSQGCNPDEFIDDDFNTILHYLCKRPFIKQTDRDIINLLIKSGMSVESFNVRGETPLYVALDSLKGLSKQKTRGKDYVDLLVENHCFWNKKVLDLLTESKYAKERFDRLVKKKKVLTEKVAVSDKKIAGCKPREGHTLNSIGTNKLFLFGGYNPRLKKGAHGYFATSALQYEIKETKKSKKTKEVGRWRISRTKSKTKPYPRAFHTCVRYGQQLYMFGGETQNAKASNNLWMYDLTQKIWRKKVFPLSHRQPQELTRHSAVVYFREKYNPWDFSGEKQKNQEKILEYKEFEFDQAALKNLPDAPNTVLGSQRMVVYGGTNKNSIVSGEVWVYNFETEKWKKRGEGPPARRNHTAVFWPKNGKMIVFGGYSKRGDLLNDTWSYCLKKNKSVKLKTTGDSPKARLGHCAMIQNDKMFVFGGNNGVKNLDDIYCLDLNTNNWTKLEFSKNITGRKNVKINFLNESEPVIVGGKSGEVDLVHLPCEYIEE